MVSAWSENNNMKIKHVVIIVFLMLSFASQAEESQEQLIHVVLLWLKEPGNQEHRQQFIDASRRFIDIPGVLDIRVGEVVMSDRKIVDDSFDVGLYVTVENEDALQNYLTHPIHIDVVNQVKPNAKRFLVYDFIDKTVID